MTGLEYIKRQLKQNIIWADNGMKRGELDPDGVLYNYHRGRSEAFEVALALLEEHIHAQ